MKLMNIAKVWSIIIADTLLFVLLIATIGLKNFGVYVLGFYAGIIFFTFINKALINEDEWTHKLFTTGVEYRNLFITITIFLAIGFSVRVLVHVALRTILVFIFGIGAGAFINYYLLSYCKGFLGLCNYSVNFVQKYVEQRFQK